MPQKYTIVSTAYLWRHVCTFRHNNTIKIIADADFAGSEEFSILLCDSLMSFLASFFTDPTFIDAAQSSCQCIAENTHLIVIEEYKSDTIGHTLKTCGTTLLNFLNTVVFSSEDSEVSEDPFTDEDLAETNSVLVHL